MGSALSTIVSWLFWREEHAPVLPPPQQVVHPPQQGVPPPQLGLPAMWVIPDAG